jgi:hypothetical protein
MITSLTNLFITISDLEQTPSDWQKGIIIPIHKSASMYDLNNYRGITLTSNVYKIYASIMENTIMAFLEDKNVLGESQRVPLEKTGTIQIYTIQKLLCSLHYCKFLLRDAIFSPVPHFSTISQKDRHAKLYQMLSIDQGKLYKLLV